MADQDELLGEVMQEMILGEQEDMEEPRDERLEEMQSLLSRQISEAANWREEDLDPDQAKATDYYKGKPFGNEEVGRSKVVSRDVKRVVQALMPSLLRIFFGPDKTVEFRPRSPEDVAAAEQKTDMVNYVIREDNPGFLVVQGAFKDALVRRLGVIKWWWEEKAKVEGYRMSGLTEQALQAVVTDPSVTHYEVTGVYPGPEGIQLMDCDVIRSYDDGRAKIDVVAPEHFLFSPNARSIDEADVVAHVSEVPASEVIAMGFDEDDVLHHAQSGRKGHATSSGGGLRDSRRFDDQEDRFGNDVVAPEREEVLFGDAYVRFDYDGDGIAELNKCYVIGDNYEIIGDPEPVDMAPFALFCPDPEPNTIVGESVADDSMDIQLVKSAIMRGMLDSLSLALNPRTEIVEGEVNIKDVMNPEVGGIVRVLKPGMMREVGHDFQRSGGAAFPMLDYMDKELEDRTGISRAAAGLDADALQSATKAAVAATLSGAQQHIEMIARVFAETGFSRLYRGLAGLLARHQDQPRMIRLRNEWVPVDPRSWDEGMDLKINIGLGMGTSEERIQLLQLVAAEQKEQLMQGSPLVSLVEYRNTLSRMVELAGFANPQEFFKPFGEQEAQQMAEAQSQQPPPPNMEEELVKLEGAKLQLEAQKLQMEDDRKRDEMALDFAAKIQTAAMQYGVQAEVASLKTQAEAARAIMEIDLARRQALPDEVSPERHPNSIGGEGALQ